MARANVLQALDLISTLETDLEHARYMNDNLLDDFFGHCEIGPLEQNKIIHHYNDARIEQQIIAHLLFDIKTTANKISKVLERMYYDKMDTITCTRENATLNG